MNLPQLLTIKEASDALKVHPNTLRLWEKEGLIASYSINGKRFKRYRKEDIIRLFENQTKRAQAFQGESEQEQLLHYKSIIESSNDAIIGKTLDGIITSWNPAAQRMFGYSPGEIIGKSTTILFPPDREDEFKEISRKIKKGEHINRFRTVRVRKNGTEIDVSCVVSPIKNAMGVIVGVSSIARDITEEIRAQKALKENEERFRLVVENSIDLIALLDKDGTYLYVSPSHKRILGYDNSDLIGKNVRMLIHPDDAPALQEEERKTFNGEPTRNIEFRLLHKNGNWVVFEGSSKAVLNDKGQPYIVVAIARDITQRKYAEEERVRLLKQIGSEKTLFKAVLDQMPSGVFIAEAPSRKLILSNKQSENILGHPLLDTAPFEQYAEYRGYHEDGTPYKSEDYPLFRSIQKGETVMNEEMDHFLNGVKITVSVNSAPIKDEEGNIIAGVVIFSDITEKKQIEKNLQFLSEASTILASSLDYDKTLQTVANLAVPQISEWCAVDLINKQGELELAAIGHEDPKKVKLGIEFRRQYPLNFHLPFGVWKAVDTGKSSTFSNADRKLFENFLKEHGLQEFIHKLSLRAGMFVPLKVRDKIIGAITFSSSSRVKKFTKNDLFVAEELAKRAASAIESARLYKEAQESISMRDEFISMASHELKTPVTSMKVYIQFLQRQLNKKRDIAELVPELARINSQVDQITELIGELLDLSRIQTGKLQYNKEFFDINTLTSEIVDLMQRTTEKHTIIISGHAIQKVYGDRARISQVIVNLLSNAIKYSETADKIIVSVIENAKNITISVQDFGIGIAKNYQEKIFDRFYQVTDRVEKTFPGLGIGLYLSAEIIKNHNGIIWVESEKGKGSTFHFTLPVIKEKTQEISAETFRAKINNSE